MTWIYSGITRDCSMGSVKIVRQLDGVTDWINASIVNYILIISTISVVDQICKSYQAWPSDAKVMQRGLLYYWDT